MKILFIISSEDSHAHEMVMYVPQYVDYWA